MDDSRLSHLNNLLLKEPQEDYPTKSRIHLLKSFHQENCFVKREDELGFGISGTKFRKYKFLIPILRRYKKIAVVGTPFSNHTLGITQLLVENQIHPILFLKKSFSTQLKGNFLFLNLLIPSSSIQWIEAKNWGNIEQIASDFIGKEGFVLNEGARVFPAFLGALSLPMDIIRNEQENGLSFDHIFIDVGMGYSASALILGFAYLKKQSHLHLLLLADHQQVFLDQLYQLKDCFEKWLDQTIETLPSLTTYYPSLAPSFGSINRKIFAYTIEMGHQEGFFLDPIYSSKLFYEAQKIIETNPLQGKVLVIHSGGALTLSGFQEQLSEQISLSQKKSIPIDILDIKKKI